MVQMAGFEPAISGFQNRRERPDFPTPSKTLTKYHFVSIKKEFYFCCWYLVKVLAGKVGLDPTTLIFRLTSVFPVETTSRILVHTVGIKPTFLGLQPSAVIRPAPSVHNWRLRSESN